MSDDTVYIIFSAISCSVVWGICKLSFLANVCHVRWFLPSLKSILIFLTQQEVADAREIRNRILSNFELAIQPGISHEEADRLLHFVIVGGGPTGVEFGAELYDFVKQVSSKFFFIIIIEIYLVCCGFV